MSPTKSSVLASFFLSPESSDFEIFNPNHWKLQYFATRPQGGGVPIMGISDVSAAVSYLTDAAHLLHSTAPATSAHLMSQRHDILFRQGIQPSDVQRQHVCGACGHILLASDGDSIMIQKRTRRRQPRLQKEKGMSLAPRTVRKGPCKVIRCCHCSKSTRVSLEPPAPFARTRTVKTKSQSQPAATTTMVTDTASDASKKPSASSSSKKRAKNRKAGLQALLAGQQKGSSSPLSLASFMKK